MLSHMLTGLLFKLREETLAHNNQVLEGAKLILLEHLPKHYAIDGWYHNYKRAIQNRSSVR